MKFALGVVLLYIAYRQRKKRGQPRKPAAWKAKLDGMSILTAAGMGVLLQPWTLVAAGVATVTGARYRVLRRPCSCSCSACWPPSTILAMEIYATFSPEAARVRLNAIRTWVDTHRDQAIISLSLVLVSGSSATASTGWSPPSLILRRLWSALTSLALILIDFTALVVPAWRRGR